MASSKVARHFFIPAGVLVAEKAKSAASEHMCKRSELPLYANDVCTPPSLKKEAACTPPPGAIENVFGTVRRNLYAASDEIQSLKGQVEGFAQTGSDGIRDLLEYLQKEENTAPRYGAIALGATAGYIMGLRGGKFKRTLYTFMGGLGMAAICYPADASEYSKQGLEEARKYATILYNFIYGVKKGDPALELPSLPKLPETMSEVWDVVKGFGNSTTSSVTDPNAVKVNDACEEIEIEVPDIADDNNNIETDLVEDDSCTCPPPPPCEDEEDLPPDPEPELKPIPPPPMKRIKIRKSKIRETSPCPEDDD